MRQVLGESADRRTCGRPCSSTLPAACGAQVPRRDALQPTLRLIKQTVTARLIEFLAGNLDALSAGLDADVVNTFLSNQLSQLPASKAGTTPWDECLKPVIMFKSSAKK
jgi:hypothetical protein